MKKTLVVCAVALGLSMPVFSQVKVTVEKNPPRRKVKKVTVVQVQRTDIDNLQEQIDRLQNQVNRLRNKVHNLESEVKELKAHQNTAIRRGHTKKVIIESR